MLLPFAAPLAEVDAPLAGLLTPGTVREVLALVPDEWLAGEPGFRAPADVRDACARYVAERLAGPRHWARELEATRAAHL